MATSDSKGRFFYKTYRFESIRITNRIEYIRIANWNALLKADTTVRHTDPPRVGRHSVLGAHAPTLTAGICWVMSARVVNDSRRDPTMTADSAIEFATTPGVSTRRITRVSPQSHSARSRDTCDMGVSR